ncbi:unnamed protein product [Paramecium primaurelia]|uniref:Uncharacterized protein n=1 Tax=Paramecium primaurelia TaxID=5886 RepID=A0A8S1M7U1_PARPR|nr:unnamed protein product [Paramecium primaurelia]
MEDYSSSKNLLLIVGQILAESDNFEKFKKLIEKKVSNIKIKLIYKTKEQEGEISALKFISEGNQVRVLKIQIEQLDSNSNNFHVYQKERKPNKTRYSQLLSLSDPDQLNEITINLKEIIQFLEFETSMHRHQKIFWAWLESTFDEDKKDVRDHADYGFPDETIIFSLGQQMIKLIEQRKYHNCLKRIQILNRNYNNCNYKSQNSSLKQYQINVFLKTFKQQVLSEKDLIYCQANDFIKYAIKHNFAQFSNHNESNEFDQKIIYQQEHFVTRIEQLNQYLEVEICRIKVHLIELVFYPLK